MLKELMHGNHKNDFSVCPPMKGDGRLPMERKFESRPDRFPEQKKSPEIVKKEAENRERKLKKILTKQLYALWQEQKHDTKNETMNRHPHQ